MSGRSARLRAGRFVAEGPQAVREALTSPEVESVYATAAALARHPEIGEGIAAATPAPALHLVSDEVLAAMSDTVTPQGMIAVCRLVDRSLSEVLGALPRHRPALVAVLNQVRDPGNAGTVLRAADAAGADAVILTDASVDVHNPKTVRSTAGSLFHLPVVTGVPLAEAVSALRGAGLSVLGADGAGSLDLDALQQQGDGMLTGPVAWVFGNEAWGLPEADAGLTDALVRIPLHGRAESLNLAMAATVCLYVTARMQRLP